MKRFIILIALFIFVILNNSYSQPKLEFDCGKQYDWGKVKPKESPLKCSIKLFNKGNELLKITKVKPGCGCTKGKLSKDEIAPGDSAIIEFSLSIRANPGLISKSVSFYTNTPELEKQMIYLKARVETGYKLNPKRMNFSTCKINKESISKLTISNTSNEDFLISRIEIKPNKLIVTGVEEGRMIKMGESIEIEAKYTPIKLGRFNPVITLFSDTHKDVSEIKITGYGREI